MIFVPRDIEVWHCWTVAVLRCCTCYLHDIFLAPYITRHKVTSNSQANISTLITGKRK